MPPQHEEVASHHSRSAEAPERLEPVGVDAELLRQRAAEEETPILQRVAFEVLVAVHRERPPKIRSGASSSSTPAVTRLGRYSATPTIPRNVRFTRSSTGLRVFGIWCSQRDDRCERQPKSPTWPSSRDRKRTCSGLPRTRGW